MTSAQLRVLVSGMIARVPAHGGATWAVLQYLLGLQRLGCDVRFVERIEEPEGTAMRIPLGDTFHASYCAATMEAFGLGDRWTLLGPTGVAGTTMQELASWARSADILVDLSGVAAGIPEAMGIPVRIYVDLDPGFTQAWHRQGAHVGLDRHTHHVTVGTALASRGSMVPDCGVRWQAILPPVVLDLWPASDRAAGNDEPLTTVGNWRSYGPVVLDGMTLGQRAHSFRAVAGLPRRTGRRFRVALSIHPGDEADRQMLQDCGWEVVDPAIVTGTPQAYQDFIQHSHAEIGVAKHGYVVARTGWISDRSACYLACGRPVIASDTGIMGDLPMGCGYVTFTDLDGAAEAVESVRRDYSRHARAARAIAVEHLNSDLVLSGLLAIAAGTP